MRAIDAAAQFANQRYRGRDVVDAEIEAPKIGRLSGVQPQRQFRIRNMGIGFAFRRGLECPAEQPAIKNLSRASHRKRRS